MMIDKTGPIRFGVEETAYHEAGHVVAAFVLGANYFVSVDIFKGGAGLVRAAWAPYRCSAEEAHLKQARRVVIGSTSSCVAQQRYFELRGMTSQEAWDR